jgi:hypothetical protein
MSDEAMPVRPIKVWLLDLPPLFAEMAASALGDDVDFELMAFDERSAPQRRGRADALLTARPPAEVERLLMDAPHLQAFVVSRDGRAVRRVRLRPVHEELGELTLAELGGAIKRSVCPT